MKIPQLLFLTLTLSCTHFRDEGHPEVHQSQILTLRSELEAGAPPSSLTHFPSHQLHPALYLSSLEALTQNKLEKACFYLKWLDQNDSFTPIRELSWLRYRSHCAPEKLTERHAHHFPSWLFESVLREKERHNLATASDLAHLAELEKTQALQLELINRAIALEPNNPILFEKRESIAPRFIENPEYHQYFDIARDLERDRQFDQARDFYERIIQHSKSQPADVLKAFERIGQTYRVQRQREVYWRELDSLAKRMKEQSHQGGGFALAYIDNRITKARSLWTAHQRSAGQEILRQLVDSPLASVDQKAQIQFILGAMELEAKNHAEAQSHFALGLTFPIEDRSLLENLLWTSAWSAYQNGNYPRAIEFFQRALGRYQEASFKQKVLFWMATARQKMTGAMDSDSLKEVITIDLYSYYSFLAHQKLKRPIYPIEQQQLVVAKSIPSVFHWLVFLNESEAAKVFLEEYSSHQQLPSAEALKAYFKAQMYDQAIYKYHRLEDKKDKERYIHLGFPRPYLEIYQQSAKEFHFPAELSLSLTRQESAFDPYARSWADAFGLMQIIPELAQRLIRELNLDMKIPDGLYVPEQNIRLGTYHLGQLKKRFDNKFPFYTAAYNAGSSPVQNWQKHRYKGDDVEFIEDIPYRETQNYVKLIFRNAVIYRALTQDRPFMIEELGLID